MGRNILFVFCTALFFCLPSPAAARGAPEALLPANLTPALDHLLAQVGPQPAPEFDPTNLERLLEFVLAARSGPLYHEPAERQKTTAASHVFELRSDLKHLLRYAFNPAIPPQVLVPSSVRRGRWTEVNGRRQELPLLWNNIAALERPLIVRGIEREEITPNLATGTYFEYELYRTLILFQHRGRPVLITLSRQKDRSQVGKKGAVLGTDADWDYLYSEEKGIARSGLGWVDSYMYDAFSIGIFAETGGGRPTVRCGSFKWLNAGWAGINMVNRSHIHEGLVRYARDLKGILEHPALPAADSLAQRFSRLAQLSTPELQAFGRRYLDRLAQRYRGDRSLTRGGMDRLLRGNAYLGEMTREELEATIALELMKALLGRPGADSQLLQAVGN